MENFERGFPIDRVQARVALSGTLFGAELQQGVSATSEMAQSDYFKLNFSIPAKVKQSHCI